MYVMWMVLAVVLGALISLQAGFNSALATGIGGDESAVAHPVNAMSVSRQYVARACRIVEMC
jgi:uncharacterized membrane protein YdcZ (DUF606 family)